MVSGALKGFAGGRNAMPTPGTIISALDIGSSKICCVIATVVAAKNGEGPTFRVLGMGTTVSRGINHGAIANLEDAERSIRLAVDGAERNARLRIENVHVNVSGGCPQLFTATAHVKVNSGVVTQRDLDTAIAAAMGKAAIGSRSIIHISPRAYAIDGVESDDSPLGLHGQVLGVEIGILTVESAALRNLRQVIASAHLHPVNLSLSSLASARGVLSPDETALGAVLIDMGAATTGFVVMRNGKLVDSDSLPIGGAHVTNDIAHGLSTTVAHAERLKTMFGSVLSLGHDDRELIAVPLLGERGVGSVHHVPKSNLTAIIRPRLEETLEMLHHRIFATGAAQGISRFVMTGGASQLQGLRELASDMFGVAVRIGLPAPLQGLSEAAMTAALAVPVGLLNLSMMPERHVVVPEAARDALRRANMGYARRVGSWLREAL